MILLLLKISSQLKMGCCPPKEAYDPTDLIEGPDKNMVSQPTETQPVTEDPREWDRQFSEFLENGGTKPGPHPNKKHLWNHD